MLVSANLGPFVGYLGFPDWRCGVAVTNVTDPSIIEAGAGFQWSLMSNVTVDGGLAAGFSEQALLEAASAVQFYTWMLTRLSQCAVTPPFGQCGSGLPGGPGSAGTGSFDDPNDTFWIKKGFEYFKAVVAGCEF